MTDPAKPASPTAPTVPVASAKAPEPAPAAQPPAAAQPSPPAPAKQTARPATRRYTCAVCQGQCDVPLSLHQDPHVAIECPHCKATLRRAIPVVPAETPAAP